MIFMPQNLTKIAANPQCENLFPGDNDAPKVGAVEYFGALCVLW
jgi:hypothetical protein